MCSCIQDSFMATMVEAICKNYETGGIAKHLALKYKAKNSHLCCENLACFNMPACI